MVGQNNPTGVEPKTDKEVVAFTPYATVKDAFFIGVIFPIANAMADTVIGFGWRRLAQARKVIIGLGLVEQVSPQTQHKPALYRWPKKPKKGKEGRGEGVS